MDGSAVGSFVFSVGAFFGFVGDLVLFIRGAGDGAVVGPVEFGANDHSYSPGSFGSGAGLVGSITDLATSFATSLATSLATFEATSETCFIHFFFCAGLRFLRDFCSFFNSGLLSPIRQ